MLLEKQALKLGLRQLTEYIPDGRRDDMAWLNEEMIRINSNPLRRANIVQKRYNENMVALFVNLPIISERDAVHTGYIKVSEWFNYNRDLLSTYSICEPEEEAIVELQRLSKSKLAVRGVYYIFVKKHNEPQFAIYVYNKR